MRIAVLGGGVGSLTTAFYLTSGAGWKDQLDVTVYQEGWRLGGKGASGRNRDHHDRIEEHGLHIFLGFYDNAFSMMTQCYDELGRNPGKPLATVFDAFKPHDYFVLMESWKGQMLPWVIDFPKTSDVPGTGGELPSPWAFLQMILGWLKDLHETGPSSPARGELAHDRLADAHALLRERFTTGRGLGDFLEDLKTAARVIVDLFRDAGRELTHTTFVHLAHFHARTLPADPKRHDRSDHELLTWLLREFRDWIRKELSDSLDDTRLRRFVILVELSIATMLGMIEDGLIFGHDWFKIDGQSFSDWLRKHGASELAVESPPVELIREFVFAPEDPGVGAGTALHYTLRMLFTYKGAFGWKMQAGMGDTVFAPLYEVLARRGVKFEFFHRVDALELSADKRNVERIRIGRQIVPKHGRYEPLFEVNGVPSWPSEPFYDQLEDGDALRESKESLENFWTRWKDRGEPLVLERGKDFDEVILGISLGGLPFVAKELVDADPDGFGAMTARVKTTQTQAAQLWSRPALPQFGWTLGPDPVLGTYYEPFDTWADMSHLIPRERWPEGAVGNIAYLTSMLEDDGPIPPREDHEYPFRQLERVKRNASRWLTDYTSQLWPAATTPNEPTAFNCWWLVDKKERDAHERLEDQYFRAVWSPSERYVLSVPNSVSYRLTSRGTPFQNLTLAGDWTLTAISSGCVEAAVMSGMHGSRALVGRPAEIMGDWLPDGGRPSVPIVPPAPPPRPRGRYVEYDGNDTPLAPYAAKGVAMYTFVVGADYGRLTKIVDERLNLGGPITYRPLGPFLSFVAAEMSPMAPLEPKAWVAEKDFGWWIPVVAGKVRGDLFEVLRPAMFIPYLWVDSYLPMQAGREVFGYPKGVGRLGMPASPDQPGSFTIEAFVVPKFGEVGDPEAQWQWKPLLAARKVGGGPLGERTTHFRSMKDLVGALVDKTKRAFPQGGEIPVPTLQLILALTGDALGMKVPMVYLKQFRDVADGRNACYQAIVESPNRVTNPLDIRAGWLEGDWEIAVEQYASVKMIDHLGLHADGGVARSAFHFWITMAFTAEDGTVVWRGV